MIDARTGLKEFFISSADLVAAKLASGRPQDLADVDSIRKAAESQTSHKAKDPRNRTASTSGDMETEKLVTKKSWMA